MKPAEHVIEDAGLAEPLKGIVHAGEHVIADEREDHGVGMHRPDASECGRPEIESGGRIIELYGHQQADDHANGAPEDGRKTERLYDLIIIMEFFYLHMF